MATYYDKKLETIKRDIEYAKQGLFGAQSADILKEKQAQLAKMSTTSTSGNISESDITAGPVAGGGMGAKGTDEARRIIAQEPGFEGSYLDGFNSVEEMQKAYAPTNPYEDMRAELQRMQQQLIEAQRERQIAGLKKSRDTALANLESGLTSAMSAYAGEEAALKPYYYDLRNRAAAQSDIGAKNFAEFMAAQGIRGSAAGLPEIYRNAALQGQIGALTRQEQAAREDIARRRTATQTQYDIDRAGILNAYEADLAAAQAGIEAQGLQAQIDALNAAQQQKIADLAAQGKTSTGELTLQGRQAQQNELAQQAALLAARYYDNIQAYINTLDPNDPLVPYLYAERQKKIQAEAEKAAAAAAAASEEEQRAWKRAFDLFQSTGRITSAEQARILGLPMDATVADVDIARMNAQTSRMNAQTAKINAEKKTGAGSLDSYRNYIDQNYGKDKTRIAAYLEGLYRQGVDPAVIDALAEEYGI